MIAAGIVLIALPLLFCVAVMIRDMGWKETAAAWGFSLFVTALIVCGALLIDAGVRG